LNILWALLTQPVTPDREIRSAPRPFFIPAIHHLVHCIGDKFCGTNNQHVSHERVNGKKERIRISF